MLTVGGTRLDLNTLRAKKEYKGSKRSSWVYRRGGGERERERKDYFYKVAASNNNRASQEVQ